MSRTSALSFRVTPEMKEALEKAAADDTRSASSFVIKVLTEHLKAKGYLPK